MTLTAGSLVSRARGYYAGHQQQHIPCMATAAVTAGIPAASSMLQHQQDRFSSTEISTKSGIQEPNRLTTVYQRMKDECPDELKAYAVCVQTANNDDELGLQQGSCQSEFGKVKECFHRARYNLPIKTQSNRPIDF